MAREVTVQAPAKINLHLEIVGRRTDGYHEILSLFQAVSLCDEILLRLAGPAGTCRIRGNRLIPPETNIAAKAVDLFRSETGIRDGIVVGMEKRIPIGGGMGGGSSDAAAVLRGLQVLFDAPLPSEKLLTLGLLLGSDVPFFLSSAAAVVGGRGEKVRPIAARGDFGIVAAIPASGVSSSDAYGWIDEARDAGGWPEPRFSSQRLERMYRTPVAEWDFSNDFDTVVYPRHGEVRRLRDALADVGVHSPRLTGSGSTVFGILPDGAAAQSCAGRVMGGRVLVVLPLAQMPSVG